MFPFTEKQLPEKKKLLKKLYLKISQNSQESTCVGVSFLIKLRAFRSKTLLKNRLQHKCFPVNIVKKLRIPILQSICERLLLFISMFSSIEAFVLDDSDLSNHSNENVYVSDLVTS